MEIQNPGGLYGQVTPGNYERVTDYRNPVVAEAMKALGYVDRFGAGIARIKTTLAANSNPPAEFTFEPTHVLVILRRRPYRSALLAADYLVIPLGADLFSLQGLRNLGPTVRTWRQQWKQVQGLVSTNVGLPSGDMTPAGYVVLQHAVRLDRPVRAYAKCLERIPAIYREAVLAEKPSKRRVSDEEHCLATLRNYRSLMPMAQDARKPIFDLRPADGALGSHAQLVQTCALEFRRLALAIAEKCGVEMQGVTAPAVSLGANSVRDRRT